MQSGHTALEVVLLYTAGWLTLLQGKIVQRVPIVNWRGSWVRKIVSVIHNVLKTFYIITIEQCSVSQPLRIPGAPTDKTE